MKIYKYEIRVGRRSLSLPRGAEILSFQCQHGTLCMWALVDPDAPDEERIFRVHATGFDIKMPAEGMEFIGTAQTEGGLVWHLFEEKATATK